MWLKKFSNIGKLNAEQIQFRSLFSIKSSSNTIESHFFFSSMEGHNPPQSIFLFHIHHLTRWRQCWVIYWLRDVLGICSLMLMQVPTGAGSLWSPLTCRYDPVPLQNLSQSHQVSSLGGATLLWYRRDWFHCRRSPWPPWTERASSSSRNSDTEFWLSFNCRSSGCWSRLRAQLSSQVASVNSPHC